MKKTLNSVKKKKEKLTIELLISYGKVYFFPIFAVLGLALMSYFVYLPYLEAIPEQLSEKTQLADNSETLTQNKETLDELNHLPLEAMASTLDNKIPTEPKVGALVELLVSLAESSGLDVVDSTDEEQIEGQEELQLEELSASERERYSDELGVLPVPVELNLVGTRQELESFFESLDSQDRVMEIETAEINISEGLWEAELVVYGYMGEVLRTALSDYSTISADDENVFSEVRRISVDLSEERFNSVTSLY